MEVRVWGDLVGLPFFRWDVFIRVPTFWGLGIFEKLFVGGWPFGG